MKSKVMELFRQAGLMDESNDQILAVGLTQLQDTLMDCIFAILFASLLGNAMVGVVFELSYLILRVYAGGYHAASKRSCFILSYFSTVACIILAFVIPANEICFLMVMICSILFIAVATPVQSENKTLNKMEKKIYKRNAICISIMEFVIGFACIIFDKNIYANTIGVSVFLVIIGLVGGLAGKK